MRYILPLTLFLTILVYSCNTGNGTSSGQYGSDSEAQGGRIYGNVLRVNETQKVQSLYPPAITDLVSSHVASQLYETLLRIDTRNMAIKPGLAERWDFDPTGRVITFHLRKGVRFHDDEVFTGGRGREITAQDVLFTFTNLCTRHPDNLSFASTFQDRVMGANDYYESGTGAVEGFRVIDPYTFSIELVTPNPSFLYVLAQPSTGILAQELVKHYGRDIKKGAGPFIFKGSTLEDDQLTLVRNYNYYGKDSLGNQLPFLDSIVFTFIPDKKAELDAFLNGNIDLIIGLPADNIREMLEKNIEAFENSPPAYILDRSPELVTHFYAFNTMGDVFSDRRVRQAFSYAIDRNKIVEDILKGEAHGPGVHGLVPPSLPGYDVSGIRGYSYDPARARELLAEAGYRGGRNFPQVTLVVNTGARNVNVAREVQRQLRSELGVHVELELASFEESTRKARMGEGNLFRTAWNADFPGPESFLVLSYGHNVPDSAGIPSYPNISRYKNPDFDRLYESALRARNRADRYAYLALAEQLMMADAPVLVLWYDEKFRVYKSAMHNFYSNQLNYWDFREVYKKPVTAADPD